MPTNTETRVEKVVNSVGRLDITLKERLESLNRDRQRLQRQLPFSPDRAAKLPKAERAAAYIAETFHKYPWLEEVQFSIGAKPKDVSDLAHLKQVAESTSTHLGELGISHWAADIEASISASSVPSPYGYGNQAIRIWGENLSLIFRPTAPAPVLTLRQPEAAYATAA